MSSDGGKTGERVIPTPASIRTTPYDEFMQSIVTDINDRYGQDNENNVAIRVPDSCIHEPDILLRVAKNLVEKGWDVMILGSFKLGDVSTDDMLANMDSAQFFVISPTVHYSKTTKRPHGVLCLNETSWKIVDGKLQYESKYAVRVSKKEDRSFCSIC